MLWPVSPVPDTREQHHAGCNARERQREQASAELTGNSQPPIVFLDGKIRVVEVANALIGCGELAVRNRVVVVSRSKERSNELVAIITDAAAHVGKREPAGLDPRERQVSVAGRVFAKRHDSNLRVSKVKVSDRTGC